MTTYVQTYSKLSDDEILNLATNPDTLTVDARFALTAELAARKLTEIDVAAYRNHLSTVRPGQLPYKEEFVARSFNGFGTAVYGKRDFAPDGSYLTTKWAVFFWIPIIPLSSMRVRPVGGSSVLFGWSERYVVCSKGRPVLQQVLYIYAFVFAFALAWWNFGPKPNIVNVGTVCLLLFAPYLLRKISRSHQ
ncbi:MAG: hypothetical protein ACRD52_10995 [Candidatus Acidiferrales bacterium]